MCEQLNNLLVHETCHEKKTNLERESDIKIAMKEQKYLKLAEST